MYKIILFTLLVPFLMACQKNNFPLNYYPAQGLDSTTIQSCHEPKIEYVDVNGTLDELQTSLQGYVFIGKAQWTDKKAIHADHAVEQGKKVGACLILWQKKYVGTIHTKKRVPKISPFQSGFFSSDGSMFNFPDTFNYEEVPVSYRYIRNTVLFFAKKAE